MEKSEGIIVILSYPDTIVRPAYWEVSSKLWPLIGVGNKHAIPAGHAAILLLQKNKPEINYYDFGRYITSYGNGRLRTKEIDPELEVTITATFKNDSLLNVADILLWVEKNPEKTHGDGRLIASIHEEINFTKAQQFIQQLREKKEIPYGAFIKNGMNCARFVADIIIASSNNKKVSTQLKKSIVLTASPIGNVIKSNTTDVIYLVHRQEISKYKNRAVLKEHRATFFNKCKNTLQLKGTEHPNLEVFELKNATWLGGIASGAWFKIEAKLNENTYTIARYTASGKKDFEGLFSTGELTFNCREAYDFMHPTNCKDAYIQQKKNTFYFRKIKSILPKRVSL